MADLTTLSHWINGSAVASQSGRYAPVYNPALGAQTKQVPLANEDEITATIQAAHEAFPAWRDISISRRQSIVFRIRELLKDRKSTRLNSSHVAISYAVFCLKKKRQHSLHYTCEPATKS